MLDWRRLVHMCLKNLKKNRVPFLYGRLLPGLHIAANERK
jgi:hypothetical protein